MTRHPRSGALALISAFFVGTVLVAGAATTPVSAATHATLGPSRVLTENFDSLANGTGTLTPLPVGADFAESKSNADDTYRASPGTAQTGDTYSFGAAGSTERAFGGLASGTLNTTVGYVFDNGTGGTITALNIAYTGEEWRLGGAGRTDRLDAQYSTDATSLTTGTWTDVDALDFVTPDTAAPTGARNGNTAPNRTALSTTISGLTILPGSAVYLRWLDTDVPGSDDGLAIDDLSITATVPATNPVAAACPAAITVPVGETITAPLSATDLDSIVVSAAVTAGSAPGIAVSNVVASPGVGGELTADFVVDGGVAATGTTNVIVTFTNADPVPQTAACTIAVRIAAPSARIHDIQSATHRSPLTGSTVSGVPGVVTALRGNGFYLQDPEPDADPATSEGIFVFTGTAPTVIVGDAVIVDARVTEFRPSAATGPNLTITELVASAVVPVRSAQPLPPTTTIGTGGRLTPATVIDDDPTTDVEDPAHVFDPNVNAIDFYESLEGMLVTVNDAAVLDGSSPTLSSGEIPVLPTGITGGVRSPRGAVLIGGYTSTDSELSNANPGRVLLDDEVLKLSGAAMPTVDVGDIVLAATGPLDYSSGNFKLEVTSTPAVVRNGLQREVAEPAPDSGLSIASYNVENLAATASSAKFDAIAAQIVDNLRSPDLLVLQEVQDFDGTASASPTDAAPTLEALVAAIAARGGPSYDFRQINPLANTDGGQPNGNIRVAFLFRTDRGLAFVDRPGGDATTATAVVNAGAAAQLSASPGRVAPTDGAFTDSRKPLAGEFTFGGHTLFVIGNHFNSKGGDDPLFGRFQPPQRPSEVQRHQQAAIVNDFVTQITAIDPAAYVVVAGDLNDVPTSRTLDILRGTALEEMLSTLPPEERYDYVFEGNAEALDHILITPALRARAAATIDVVRVNAEFGDQISDHDPELLALDFASQPQTITFDPPATGPAGTTIALSATGGASSNGVVLSVNAASDSGVCSLSGTTLTLVSAGNCVVDANQAGNADYLPAPMVTRTIMVTAPPAMLPGGRLVVDGPTRMVDTRLPGQGGRLGPRQVRRIALVGAPADAVGIVATVTVVDPAADGWLNVWPCEQPEPLASTHDYKAGTGAWAGQVTIGVGNGSMCVSSYASVDVVVDRIGWMVANGGSGYLPVRPQRVVDTRQALGGTRVSAGGVLRIDPSRAARWPTDATVAVVQLTATDGAGPGFVRAYACDQPMPDTSSVNTRGPRQDAYSSLVTVPLAADGTFCVWSYGATDIVVDVAGAWTPTSVARLLPSRVPYRVVDTRDGLGGTRLAAGGVLQVPSATWGGGIAVAVNVVAVNAAGPGFLTLFDCASAPPDTSNVNYPAAGDEPDGFPTANAAQVAVAPGGALCVYSYAAVDIVLDVAGNVPAPPG